MRPELGGVAIQVIEVGGLRRLVGEDTMPELYFQRQLLNRYVFPG